MLHDLNTSKTALGGALAPPTAARGADGRAVPAQDQRAVRHWFRLGLPVKLLILTALFVMLAEVLIFLPSLASFRINWLNDRVTTAQVSALAADAVPGRDVPPALRNELLRTALVRAIAVRRSGARRVVLPPVQDFNIDVTYDLRQPPRLSLSEALTVRLSNIRDALGVILYGEDRTMRVIGLLGPRYDDVIEVVMPEEPLRRAMMKYATEIFWLSLLMALVAAALVYFAINSLLVKPILRLSRNMVAYSASPEDTSRIIAPSGRTDEIGEAEEELSQMQRQLSQLLKQKTRLAQLGLAVSKINHDLRNMLANAQLISDRLTEVEDPTVQRVAPKLIASLDRAISFCNETLRFGRTEEMVQRREKMMLKPLVEDVGENLGLGPDSPVAFIAQIDPAISIDADRNHVIRILGNLVRNAVQALEADEDRTEPGVVRVTAWRADGRTRVIVSDNGPGIAPKAREKLFQPFQGSTKRGGTGLGLPIAAELAQAHGGSLRLLETTVGAAFELEIPDRQEA